ncbi:MAG: EF-P lysine aminoacylase GenX [Proteobacteria bacterium]|nr:EF-P lysine aminoacylase GenX [Pseudomonadota bacterium]MBU1717384.1 EF-P lysine aminoacylase GenX [Pseudomonadota bacterium]
MISVELLKQRAAIIQAVRCFFMGRGFLEVETPVRIPAPAPEVHIEPETSGGWFLQASPELCMKRLLAAGAINIFQICKCFRRGERGRLHLPELTMLEWYRVGANYEDLMTDCEDLLRFVGREIGRDSIEFGGRQVSLTGDWPRITVEEAYRRYGSMEVAAALAADKFDQEMVCHIEPELGLECPAFLVDYPASLASLACLKKDDAMVAERFELYVAGVELANGFSELNDPDEQRLRFEQEMERIIANGRQPGPLPERFLTELALMPEAAGIALGIDRLVMLFTGKSTIDEVIAFQPEYL